MSRFAAIKSERSSATPKPAETAKPKPTSRPSSRAGKRAVCAYFSLDLSRALHMLALERDVSLQALMGEAFDDLMRKYGKHPFGER